MLPILFEQDLTTTELFACRGDKVLNLEVRFGQAEDSKINGHQPAGKHSSWAIRAWWEQHSAVKKEHMLSPSITPWPESLLCMSGPHVLLLLDIHISIHCWLDRGHVITHFNVNFNYNGTFKGYQFYFY